MRHAYFLGAGDPYKGAQDLAEVGDQRRGLGNALRRHVAPLSSTGVGPRRRKGHQPPGR